MLFAPKLQISNVSVPFELMEMKSSRQGYFTFSTELIVYRLKGLVLHMNTVVMMVCSKHEYGISSSIYFQCDGDFHRDYCRPKE